MHSKISLLSAERSALRDLLRFQLNDDQLGRAVKPNGKTAVAQTAAHDKCCAVVGMHPVRIFGKKPFTGCKQSADDGQSDLTAVGMTGKNKICSHLHVLGEMLGSVGEQYGIMGVVCQMGNLLRRQLASVNKTGKLNGFAVDFNYSRAILEDGNTIRFHLLFEGSVFIWHAKLVVSADIVTRRYLSCPGNEGNGNIHIGIIGVDQIAGDNDDIRLRRFQKRDKGIVICAKFIVVQIGNVGNAEAVKAFGDVGGGDRVVCDLDG